MATLTVIDPRDLDQERELEVEFTIDSYGFPANTFGLPEDCDPGAPAEISITSARDFTGANVLSLLTTDQAEAIETHILENFDFSPTDDEDWY